MSTEILPIPTNTAERIAETIEKSLGNLRVATLAIKGSDFDGSEELNNHIYRGVEDDLYILMRELYGEEESPTVVKLVPASAADIAGETGNLVETGDGASTQIQILVAAIRQLARELNQVFEETAAIGSLIKHRFDDVVAKHDERDVSLRLSFDALCRTLQDAQLNHSLRDKAEALARMVGLE